MKFIIAILFITTFNTAFGQIDTFYVDGVQVIGGGKVLGPCETFVKNNKVYTAHIGATFHVTVLASGWFKLQDENCAQKTYIESMVESKFYLNEEDLFIKYKKGKPYNGRIKDSDGLYKIIGRCKNGLLHGKIIIKDNKNNVIWEGELKKQNIEK